MISYEVKVDEAQLADAKALFEFVGGNSADAVRVAINRTAGLVRTSTKLPGGGAVQRITNQVNLKPKYVRDNLELIRATKSRLSAKIRAESRGILITRFSTIPAIASGNFIGVPQVPARGIRVKIKKTGTSIIFQGTKGKKLPAMEGKPFFMRLKQSNALGIVRRLAGSKKVHAFHGPSVSQLFNNIRKDLTPVANERLQIELLDAMRFLLTKKYPKE